MSISLTELTESEVRRLRDLVFDQVSSDKNWESCREYWLKPEETAWLVQRARTMKVFTHLEVTR